MGLVSFEDETKGKVTVFGQDVLESILERVMGGMSVVAAIKADGRIKQSQFYQAVYSTPAFLKAYLIAQESRAEYLADDIIEIADTDADPIRARNRIEARKWYASKMQPKKYGDAIQIDVTERVDIKAAINEAISRVATLSIDTRNKELEQNHDDAMAQALRAKELSELIGE